MIFKLQPFISHRIWGGKKLSKIKKLKALEPGLDPIGETWEVSTHKEGTSYLFNSKTPLSEKVNLDYLIKFLDTDDVLSVQVHPGDEYATKFENDKGKKECWLILAAENEAGIYLGFKPNVTKEIFKQALQKGENVSLLLNYFKVKKGDFFFVPPGTIHAIGAGITLIEVQQSSGVTYRVWDWNRVDKNGVGRPLHVDKSFDVLNDDPNCNTENYFRYQQNVFSNISKRINLAAENEFSFDVIKMNKDETINLNLVKSKFYSLILIEGELELEKEMVQAYETHLIFDQADLELKANVNSTFIWVN